MAGSTVLLLLGPLAEAGAALPVVVLQGEPGPRGPAGPCTAEPWASLQQQASVLTAASLPRATQLVPLQQQAQSLQDQADAVCQIGYEDAGDPTARVCRRDLGDGTIDEMVRVGDFLIDRYEASLWNNHSLLLASGLPQVDDNCTWGPPTARQGGCMGDATGNGFGVTGIAASVRGARVLQWITWFQAQALCVNAGKRLCTNEEWQVAAEGTPDTGAGDAAACSINSVLPLAAAGKADTGGWNTYDGKRYLAGASAGCVSDRGVFDMVGNVWEWVAWWQQAGGLPAGWTDGKYLSNWGNGYGGDGTFNLAGRANGRDGLPAAGSRGGNWEHNVTAGAFEVDLLDAPSNPNSSVGFRCCRSAP